MKEELLKIINNYGVIPQLEYFQTEIWELNEAIIYERATSKYGDERNDYKCIEHIAEELADNYVMLYQFKEYYNLDFELAKDIIKFDSEPLKFLKRFFKDIQIEVYEQLIEQLQQENKILKENAENNDKVVDKVNWENQLLKKENKQLKEQLLVTQTNEETFRLEMKDITQTLGLDEDTIFDDVKAYARSLKDNWNKLKEFIVKEYYMYLPLAASTKSITILIDKMQELEKGSGSNE